MMDLMLGQSLALRTATCGVTRSWISEVMLLNITS